MRLAALALAALLPAAPAAADSGALTVIDKNGNLITITNGAQANGGAAIQIASSNRYGGVNWSTVHRDNRAENAYAATVDKNGNIYIGGGRVWQGNNYFWLIKVSPRGDLLWETAVQGWPGCYGFWLATNLQSDSIWESGACQTGSSYPMMVARFDAVGNVLWTQRFSQGARNYVRAMALDFLNHVSIIVEVGQGNYAGTSNQMRTVVYDQSGYQVANY